ncbi:hypothetical protein HanRHA438_Chr10g0456311 [Helianthus annuus]|uniref:Uncharacterized protein n=1 Tax=Helianthus annuus TaxID=4232 RepID=A0A251TJX7_HELAN|nr:hypothetical protein HanXRQr2_Chr10g0443881 [Helianthus annuus]KAJ0514061.1 hypothetical protein HanHA300_Chr10g0365111 [Helianthus annuus]KAJ0522100.1 hypothetical protein HanIR_Chr10g0478691 [Helianthus annuus]KAJ0530179.1 hypothetical protein HanHA89_Chr10g0386711 [Helianthus annuus]KAJ0697050.1 hypothetical protein HanLR1_Chr10g0364371 [Helianthus annuus]
MYIIEGQMEAFRTRRTFAGKATSTSGSEMGVFVFCEKLFLTTSVCAKKTKGRHRGRKCVCFSDASSSWRRHGPATSNLFKPLLNHLHILSSSSKARQK